MIRRFASISLFVLCALFGASPSWPKPMIGHDWEFGRYYVGQSFQTMPPHVQRRKCDDRRDMFSCEVLFGDGVWYVFEHRRIVEKTIYLPTASLPDWISPHEGPQTTRRRLERRLGLKFKIWTDDYGVVFVETRDLIRSPRGAYYNIVVTFKDGRMQDVAQTPLPHV